MDHSLQPLLLADIGEVIGSLFGLLMLLLWVINQIVEGKKRLTKQEAKSAGQAAGQRAAPLPAGGKPAVEREPVAEKPASGGLRGEVEDFLRRAAAQQPGGAASRPQTARRGPASGDRIEVLVDERGRTIERRRPAEPTRPVEPRRLVANRSAAPTPLRQPEATAEREPVAKRTAVAEHVRQHIDSGARALGEHSSQLGQRIVQDDAEFDIQLKSKFDHEVGTLASKVRVTDTPSQSPASAAAASPAAQLAAMLASPQGVQQAVIMNEILRRPSERW